MDNTKYDFRDMGTTFPIQNTLIQHVSNIYGCELSCVHELVSRFNAEEFYSSVPKFGITDRNSPLVRHFYTQWDANDILKNTFDQFLVKEIIPRLFPKEDFVVCQKTPNIRIHLPNQTNIGRLETDPSENVIGLHCDLDFNHPKEEWNIIIPLTRMFDSNSIYHETTSNSAVPFNEWKSIQLETNQSWCGKLNSLRHFNKINTTSVSRVSFDLRMIAGSTFQKSEMCSATSHKKFTLGEYYKRIDLNK